MQIFDIIGPIMIGPSSSHTAGAVRIGKYTRSILGSVPVKAEIYLSGSFAKTYKGHGTDKAIIGGILGMETDDENIPISMDLAKKSNLEFQFIEKDIDGAHPNTASIVLEDSHGKKVSVRGASIGGGNIVIHEINGTIVSITGKSDTLIITHKDVPGVVAEVSNILGNSNVNIHGLALGRNHKGGTAVITIEIDGTIEEHVNDLIKEQDNIIESIILRAI